MSFLPMAEDPSAVPSKLGRYKIVSKVASGGMATVYVGRRRGAAGFERVVAIKVCHSHLRRQPSFAAMFLEEARLAARIHHPNVVPTLDVSDGDPLFLVMEFIEGDSLASLRKRARAVGDPILPLEVTLRIMSDALAGLHGAHESRGKQGEPLGLVHCDISPQNILVGFDGVSRITDFGIARAAAHADEDDQVIRGKFAYMAPEQLMSEGITRQADVYAAGVVMWELLTGRLLFRRETDTATINASLHAVVPPPSAFNTRVPAALDAIVLRAVQRDVNARYATASEFLRALEELPLAPATTRAMSEYVRMAVGEETIAAHRRHLHQTMDETNPESFDPSVVRLREPPASETIEIEIDVDPMTKTTVALPSLRTSPRVPATVPIVLHANAEAPNVPVDSNIPDAHRARRLIVALSLILVGCGAGLLFAMSQVSQASSSAPDHTVAPQSGR